MPAEVMDLRYYWLTAEEIHRISKYSPDTETPTIIRFHGTSEISNLGTPDANTEDSGTTSSTNSLNFDKKTNF